MSRERRELGRRGECLAEAHLGGKGYRLLERSYRCRLGEADLIMRDGDTVVFIEVKTRSSGSFGTPEEAVDARKQRKLVQVAQFYLRDRGLDDAPARFDVVAVADGEIRHIPDAFRVA